MSAPSNSPLRQSLIGFSLLLVGVLLFVGALFGLQNQQLQQSQDPRSAASSIPTVVLDFNDLPGEVRAGEKVALDLFLNTQQLNISGLQLGGVIDGVAADDLEFETTQVAGMSPVVQTITPETETSARFFLVNFANLDSPFQYTTQNDKTRIGRLVFRPQQSVVVTVSLDSTVTKASSLELPVVQVNLAGAETYTILVEPVGDFPPDDDSDSDRSDDNEADDQSEDSEDSSKKTCNQNCATDTECRSDMTCYEGRCRNPDFPRDDQCAPDRGLNRSCNQYCADSTECSDEFECYYNFCRNPLNVESESCSVPPSPSATPVTVASTANGTGGTSTAARTSPSPSPLPSPSPSPSPSPVASASASPSLRQLGIASPSPRLEQRDREVIEPSFEPLSDDVVTELESERQRPSLLTRVLQVIAILFVVGAVAVGVIWYLQSRE